MKCLFEHDEDCCNRNSPQYMCKCKTDVCHCAIPMTNADRFRSMSDEELAEANVRRVYTTNEEYGWSEYITSDEERFENFEDAVNHELEWLRQPAQ